MKRTNQVENPALGFFGFCRLPDRQAGLTRIYSFLDQFMRDLGAAMSKLSITTIPPIRRQAADVLRRARRLPIGHARNDLRQLAIGLLWLEKRGFVAIVEDRDTASKLGQAARI
jgi:hypothetical protein